MDAKCVSEKDFYLEIVKYTFFTKIEGDTVLINFGMRDGVFSDVIQSLCGKAESEVNEMYELIESCKEAFRWVDNSRKERCKELARRLMSLALYNSRASSLSLKDVPGLIDGMALPFTTSRREIIEAAERIKKYAAFNFSGSVYDMVKRSVGWLAEMPSKDEDREFIEELKSKYKDEEIELAMLYITYGEDSFATRSWNGREIGSEWYCSEVLDKVWYGLSNITGNLAGWLQGQIDIIGKQADRFLQNVVANGDYIEGNGEVIKTLLADLDKHTKVFQLSALEKIVTSSCADAKIAAIDKFLIDNHDKYNPGHAKIRTKEDGLYEYLIPGRLGYILADADSLLKGWRYVPDGSSLLEDLADLIDNREDFPQDVLSLLEPYQIDDIENVDLFSEVSNTASLVSLLAKSKIPTINTVGKGAGWLSTGMVMVSIVDEFTNDSYDVNEIVGQMMWGSSWSKDNLSKRHAVYYIAVKMLLDRGTIKKGKDFYNFSEVQSLLSELGLDARFLESYYY